MEIVVTNASCGYGADPILKDVSLTLRQGEIVAILGPNGIGKTTIFKSVLGFLPLLEGNITLNGQPREELSQKEFSRHVGYVPQSHEPPFPYSVPDVVVMGRASRLKNLETPGLKEYMIADKVMESLEISYLREKTYTQISGGERQMVLIARALAAKGNAIAIHCNNDTSSAEKLAAELKSQGAVCEVFRANLSQPEAAKELVAQVMARFGRIDILVNNAGCLADATVAFMSDQQWNSVLELNLSAPFRLMRAVAMLMARNRWGRIVNIASAAGRLGSANRSNYASAKEGLLGLTRSAARELAGLGVRVNAVAPGFVDTNMTSNIQDKRRQDIMRDIPVRRFGKPEDIAAAVAFLASDEADYITGQCLSVDGGLVMG